MHRIAALSFALFAASPALAGGPLDVAARGIRGWVEARTTAGPRTTEQLAWLDLQFGPCALWLLPEVAGFTLLGESLDARGQGAFGARRGRVRIAPNVADFADEVRSAYLTACEVAAEPEACVESLATRALSFRSARIEVRAATRDGLAGARVRGSVELALTELLRQEEPFRWRLQLREASPLELYEIGPVCGGSSNGSLTLLPIRR